jgi:hypothetical protein
MVIGMDVLSMVALAIPSSFSNPLINAALLCLLLPAQNKFRPFHLDNADTI